MTHPVRLTADNGADIISGYDIVLDGCDNFETRFLLNDAAHQFGIPWVYGGCIGADRWGVGRRSCAWGPVAASCPA